MTNPYDDIIHLPRPVSRRHAPMAIIDRAAQFAPFAALTGYDAAIQETARLTDSAAILDESAREALDEKLRLLQNIIHTTYNKNHLERGGFYHFSSLKKIVSQE